ncbi:MAG: hypothetical protein JWR08_862 [Enterovirga sp.]|jgi:hypothetical protein|nr:hypothetical protein [Enterovirga sp.]
MVRPFLAGLALASALVALPAAAQTGAPGVTVAPPGSVGATGTGGLPEAAGSTTAVGRTKPPGAAADGYRPDLEEKSRQLDRKINTGICTGCK